MGFNVGLNLAFGSHIRRLGANLNFYYYFDGLQLNSELKFYRSFKNLGPKLSCNELVLSQGIVVGYGTKSVWNNPFITVISNQTGYINSIGYAFNAYFNKLKTTQQTGIFSLQFDGFHVITENDILARPMLDRFRTGAFLLMYQYQNLHQFAINCSMWTGQMGNKVNLTDSSFTRCYMDTTGGAYTQYSHGLLSCQFKSMLPYNQAIQFNLGVDAEKVRNVVQNKIIHDMVFLPKKWRSTKNCHIPMLDSQGNQFLYKTNQQLQTPKLYWNFFLNPSTFY